MKITLLFVLVFVVFNLFGQPYHDAKWILGQDGDISLDFNSDTININLKNEPDFFTMASSNISMSDSLGNLLFYSSGCDIIDRNDKIMIKGDSINPGVMEQFYCSVTGDSPISQGLLSLPLPNHSDIYYVFNLDLDIVTYEPDNYQTLDSKRIYYSIVDMSQNNGLGEVMSKNNILVEDPIALAQGQLTAVKHANGIDWWIICPQAVSNCYYKSLLTSEGIVETKLMCEGVQWTRDHGIGQAVFSPDGTKYTRFNPWNGLHIFDFDRCLGTLSNSVSVSFLLDTFGAAGVSISPNSRFLYATTRNKLYQFDLEASDISNSRILVDTLNVVNTPPFSAVFYLAQLAPNNKIYISGISSHLFLHVINEPDSLGLACDFDQQAIELPAFNFASIPNFPNFRLGAIEGECTTVSTDNSNIEASSNVLIYPNPSSQNIFIKITNTELINSDYVLFDVNGVKQYEGKLNHSTEEIHGLSSGIYFLQIANNNQSFVEKIVIQND